MSFETLGVERDGTDRAVAIITFNRPQVLNALNRAMLGELDRAAPELGSDDSVRVLILTGAGDRAFVAGADIKELAAQTAIAGREFSLIGQRVFDRIERLGKPVIAAINGF